MKTGIEKFEPKTQRENQLASFWYYKGKAEGALLTAVGMVTKKKKRTTRKKTKAA